MHKDGDIITQGTNVAEGVKYRTRFGMVFSEWNPVKSGIIAQHIIKANSSGRIFYLTEDDSEVDDDTPIAIIGDTSDTKDTIMKWYNNMK